MFAKNERKKNEKYNLYVRNWLTRKQRVKNKYNLKINEKKREVKKKKIEIAKY